MEFHSSMQQCAGSVAKNLEGQQNQNISYGMGGSVIIGRSLRLGEGGGGEGRKNRGLNHQSCNLESIFLNYKVH